MRCIHKLYYFRAVRLSSEYYIYVTATDDPPKRDFSQPGKFIWDPTTVGYAANLLYRQTSRVSRIKSQN